MESDKTLNSLQKVWKSGTTLVVAVPRRIREVLGLNKGDYIKVTWGDIIKKAVQSKKELPKIVNKNEKEDELPEI